MASLWKKKQFWGAVIGVVLLAFCVKDIRIDELRALVQRLHFGYLGLSVVCSFGYILLRAFRWRLMVSQQKRIPHRRVAALYAAGQVLSSAMPALTGQVGRLILFARKEGLRKTFIFSTMVLEILFDGLSLIVFVIVASFVFSFPEQYRVLGYVISGATTLLLVVLLLGLHFQVKIEDLGRKRFRDRWPGVYITIKKFIRSFSKGTEMLRSSQHLMGSMSFSIAAWLVHILVIFFLFRSFGFYVPFAAAAGLMIVNTIVLMVPITPGNAGTFEVAVTVSLKAFSVSGSDAVLFAMVLHLIDLIPMFVLGFFFFHVEKLDLKQLRQEQEQEAVLGRISDEGTYVEEEETV
jgi:uncharacterized protein (TIRG00374 family)